MIYVNCVNDPRSGSWGMILIGAKECIFQKMKEQVRIFYGIRGRKEDISPGGCWGEYLESVQE